MTDGARPHHDGCGPRLPSTRPPPPTRMAHAFEEYTDTPLWRVVAAAVAELEETREITISTAPDYVIGYLCQRLVAGRIASEQALTYEP